MKMEGEKIKTAEIIEREREMALDAAKQIELAFKLYARFHGMENSEKDTYGNDVITFWEKEDENGESYYHKYKEFVNSDKFKNDPRLQGNIGLIEIDDFIS